jgi:Ca2+-binding EF-hand superfamily protein
LAFNIVEGKNSRYITASGIKGFLRRHNEIYRDEFVEAIIRRLDFDKDSRVSYVEFCEAVRVRDIAL